ncbi:replication initiation protein [Hymenobacter terricola]|uniref:replication initiation protein n=1 Tax=Hymenobacter terricola TaxID=2819236 RepID=UPI001B30E130|nr:replication initiation protein [Hymenobacter terricola]
MQPEDPNQQLAQHNALINARFSMIPLQMRLFVSMLARQDFGQTEFRSHLIPIKELILDSHGGSSYERVDAMCQNIMEFKIYIEKLEPQTRRRTKKPAFTYINLISTASWEPELGGVVASFNVDALPYLLQLQEAGNFTLADLQEVQKLKSPSALRIYWLLKEYAEFGRRTMSVQELRFVLDVQDHEYPQFRSFKAKILEPARDQLAVTDIPFSYEVQRQGKVVQRVSFQFARKPPAKKAPVLPVDSWATALLELGLKSDSIKQVEAQLKAKEYDEGYLRFVIERVGSQHRLGKIKKPAGAIYKALVEKYLLPDYLESQRATALPKKALAAKKVAVTAEVAYLVDEVRAMYDNPGPFAKKDRLPTFEEHLQAIYLSQGFGMEERGGQKWLVKK